MISALFLFVVGMALSAFFSGSETGFYRVNRARLLIGALEGDWISRGLLWATSNPAAFVATALVGNNVANYTTSAAIVMAAATVAPGWPSAELVAPMLLAPVIFVYGELLPKNVFFSAPHRLLRRCAPLFGIFAVIFAPVSFVLWLFNKLIELAGNKSPQELQMVLARRELTELLDEGEAVGLLKPTQQVLAQATLALSNRPTANFMTPVSRFPRVTTRTSPAEAVAIARRSQRSLLPVEEVQAGRRETTGYVLAADCLLASNGALPLRPLLTVREKQNYLSTLSQLLAADVPMARVVNPKQQTVGFVTLDSLKAALLAE